MTCKGINASIELIHRTRGGRWPTEPVTEDFNFVDLVWHECEFRDGRSFTYAVYDKRDRYLGGCYLYPMGTRTPLREELLAYDVDVSWWVTPHAYEHGYYTMLYAALQHWIKAAFPFTSVYYSNTEIPANPGHVGVRPSLGDCGQLAEHVGAAQGMPCQVLVAVIRRPGVVAGDPAERRQHPGGVHALLPALCVHGDQDVLA
jgi:hypothetical protein